MKVKKKVSARRSVPALIHMVAPFHQYNGLTGHDKNTAVALTDVMFYFFFSRAINVKSILLCLYLGYIVNIMFLCV